MEITKMSHKEMPRHRKEIDALLKLCLCESGLVPQHRSFYDEKLDALEQYLREDKAFLFSASDDGRVIGFLWACIITTPFYSTFHVLYFAVLPEYQRHGVGKELLRAAEIEAKAHGLTQMELNITAQNASAMAFYTGQSFNVDRYVLSKQLM